MSLLGKVLVVLNLLAAVAFLAIASMDYAARQGWAYAAFRGELLINGLPLDDSDDSWRPGVPIARDLTPKLLQEVFGGPESVVSTQAEGVAEMRKSAIALIDAASTDLAKRRAIGTMWLPLLSHSSQRENLLAQLNTTPVDKLLAAFDGLFVELENAIKSGNQAPAVLRARVADLLLAASFNADPAGRNFTRAVVGLEEYVAATTRQAENLYGIANNLDRVIREDSAAFVRQSNDLTPRLSLLNEQLKADTARLDGQRKIFEQNNQLFQARKAERDELRQQIADTVERATAEAANLAAVQRQLFDLQREVAAAREGNQKLETQIRGKELGR